MNVGGFFSLIKHAEVHFVVNLQLKVDYADLSCKYANFFAIYADLFFKHQKGGSPSPHNRDSKIISIVKHLTFRDFIRFSNLVQPFITYSTLPNKNHILHYELAVNRLLA